MPWADPHSFYSLSFRWWWDASFSQFILLAQHLWSQTTHPQHCRKNWVTMFLFVWTYFSFQIPKIYILLWFFDYHHMYYMSTLMFQQLFHTFFRNAATSKFVLRSRPLAPKALRRRELCRSETLSACFVACSNWMAKGQGFKGPKSPQDSFLGSFPLQLIFVSFQFHAALQFAKQTTLRDHAVLQNEPDTNSETSSKLHTIFEAGILRPSVSFAPIPCFSPARATWSASSCGAVANWRSGRHYGVLILEFQDPITNKLADNMVSDW